ncbi:MAG: hypothetical protein JWM97_1669, partial [Phycisphaerales bacterium]|nr:hypothetical protein [Phycisphaerales bacterium]
MKSILKYMPRLLRYLVPYWGLAVGAVAVTLAVAGVGLLAPWPMAF